jgi:hypothetical protein
VSATSLHAAEMTESANSSMRSRCQPDCECIEFHVWYVSQFRFRARFRTRSWSPPTPVSRVFAQMGKFHASGPWSWFGQDVFGLRAGRPDR